MFTLIKLGSQKKGELIWLKGPSFEKEFHIVDGPDVSFDLLKLNGEKAPFVVYAAEFFAEKLSALVVECGGVVKQSTTLDASIGRVYDVRVENLIAKSKAIQLVVTNYKYSKPGSLFIYEMSTPTTVSKKTTVYDQFKNVQWLPGSGAPGFAYPHWPTNSPASGQQANILVCGDGAQSLSLFVPQQTKTNATLLQNYKLAYLKHFQSTVGGVGIYDVDNDGTYKIFVSLYDVGKVLVYQYK